MTILLFASAMLVVALTNVRVGLIILLAYASFHNFLRLMLYYSPIQAGLKDLFVLFLFLAWLVKSFVKGEFKYNKTALDVPIFLFVAVALFGLLRAPIFVQGLFAFRLLIIYIPVYFIVVNNIFSKKQLQSILGGLTFIALITSCFGIFQFFMGGEWLDKIGYTWTTWNMFYLGRLRVMSTFGNPWTFSLFLVMAILIFLSVLDTPLLARWQKRGIYITLIASFLALAMTMTRTGWLGLGIGVVFLSFLKKRTKIFFFTVVLFVVSILLLPQSVLVRATMTFTAADLSFWGRTLTTIPGSFLIIAQNLLGMGLGVLGDAAFRWSAISGQKAILPIGIASTETVALSIGIQMGALGLSIYVWIFLLILRRGMKIYRNLTDPFLKNLTAGMLAFFMFITTCNFLSGSTEAFPIVDLYFWFAVGLLMTMRKIEKQNSVYSNIRGVLH